MRIIAIDYGLKRVGLAVTDPLQTIAIPLEMVARPMLIHFLQGYLGREKVAAFVLGMPQGLDGLPSVMSKWVIRMGKQLVKLFPEQALYYQDERFTSRLARHSLYQAGYGKKDRRENVDKVSAALLLQSFLAKEGKDGYIGII